MTPQKKMREALVRKQNAQPAFYQSLKQPPRSMKQHGTDRKPSPPAHGHPADGAGAGAGGTFFRTVFSTFPTSEPPTIPYAGIRTGEIIGHRLWWVIPEGGEDWLCSLAHRRLWTTGETVEGKINELVNHPWFGLRIYGGVYSFLDAVGPIEGEIFEMEKNIKIWIGLDPWMRASIGWCALEETLTFVQGTVKMWGDVVEHECGYRAQFAKVHTLDKLYGAGDLDALRHKYGVG